MIITVAEAADWLKDVTLATDAQFQRLVAAADAFVKHYCARDFERAERTEYPRSHGGSILWLREKPIAAVAEIRIDPTHQLAVDSAIELTDVVYEDDRVYLLGYWPEGSHVVMVTYTGGYWPASDTDPLHIPKMPEDLREVTLDLVARAQRRGSTEVMQSESLGSYSYTRFAAALTSEMRDTLLYFKAW